MTVGTADAMGIDVARDLARQAIVHIKSDKPTSEPAKVTVADIAERWLDRHVRGHRTARERSRIVSRYIAPHIGNRALADVRRKDVAALLDRIEDQSGRQMADSVLKTFRAMAKWVQLRDENYNPPLTAGMSRVPRGEGRRKRILGDDEIRAVWNAPGVFGDFCRLALLTAQRREKLATLRWDDIDAKGVWTIRTEEREKGNPGRLRLPQVALDIIQRQPRFVGNAYVFAGRNNGGASGIIRQAMRCH
jgi:integrase